MNRRKKTVVGTTGVPTYITLLAEPLPYSTSSLAFFSLSAVL
jgi:hypothetical protein